MSTEAPESGPDKIIVPHLVKEVMNALSRSDEAAYRVYLLLCNKFGAGQKIC